ncbi:hypothetical protein [Pseudomonas sp.]|uniref:hypothetical protein n=1 Tax=Pseudomonas sp. TaxID=306 RepID=UPI0028B1E84E|nr:hypothetical protein [Pseudomonas sp.]
MAEADQPSGPLHTANLQRVCAELGLPSDTWLMDFWRQHGGTWLVDHVVIYAIDDVQERNHTFEVAQYFPRQIAVGDDSGGRLILVDRLATSGLWLVDAGSPSLDGAEHFDTLAQLAAALAREYD